MRSVLLITTGLLLSLAGCGERDADAPAPVVRAPAPTPPSDWRQLSETVVLELSEDDRDALAAAAERARAAAPLARDRFQPAAPGQADEWFVLAALAVDGGAGFETVWLAVDAWSEHRIEGRLASPPSRPLRSARELGDPVAIPAGDLVDWLYRPRDSRVEEGGFTLDALEARRGAVENAVPTRAPDDDPPAPGPGN